jgi:hypothetical protein
LLQYTFGEAGMEALGNSQQFRAEKIADFTENMVMSRRNGVRRN